MVSDLGNQEDLDNALEDIEEQDAARHGLKMPDDLEGLGEDGEEVDYGDEIGDYGDEEGE